MELDYTITNKDRIAWILQSLQDNHQTVKLTFGSNQQAAQSLIMSVDVKRKSFLIDPPAAEQICRLIKSRSAFEIDATLDGVDVNCQNLTLDKVVRDSEGELYRVGLPASMQYIQRRDSFRAQVIGILDVPVVINPVSDPSEFDSANCVSDLADISHEGCKITIRNTESPVLENAGTLLDLELYLPEAPDPVRLSAESRYCRHLSRLKLCDLGCKFIYRNAAEQQIIGQFVADMQRKKRQLMINMS